MELKKAYDLEALKDRLVEQGLAESREAAEDIALKYYETLKDWAVSSAKMTDNPYDDLSVPAFNYLDPIVYEQIDKIDGEEG